MGGDLSKTTMSESKLHSLIQSHDVILFVSGGCPYCSDAVRILQEKGIAHHVVEASGDERKALSKMTGMSSVPNVWVKGEFVGGCNDGPLPWMGIAKLARNGELTNRLAK